MNDKKVIWITGASSGIGRSLALKFAKEGWTVAASARRENLLQELHTENENIHSFPLDVTNTEQCKATFNDIVKKFENDFGIHGFTFAIDDWPYEIDYSNELLSNQFATKSLKGFGISDLNEAVVSAGVVLHYLKETKHNQTSHILSISRINEEKYLWMDKFTMRNLELFNSPNNGAKTMLDILDSTETSMGSRMLMRWLALPLKKINEINERLDIVNYLIDNTEVLNVLKDNIYQIGDLERLVSKASTKRINPKEVEKLKDSLLSIVPIKQVCLKSNLKSLNLLGKKLNDCSQLVDLISKELSDNPPSQLNKGNVINSGFNSELDELRLIRKSGKDFLDKMLTLEPGDTPSMFSNGIKNNKPPSNPTTSA